MEKGLKILDTRTRARSINIISARIAAETSIIRRNSTSRVTPAPPDPSARSAARYFAPTLPEREPRASERASARARYDISSLSLSLSRARRGPRSSDPASRGNEA